MSIYGENIKLNIFGQSHSAAIGMSLEGIPAGHKLDFEKLQSFMDRRAPGKSPLSTARKESDVPEFLSGLKENVTCGVPIAAIIRNSDTRSADYTDYKTCPRPGHADYTAEIKYNGFQDYSGGGAFSGRMTAPLCLAGGICLQLLEKEGIKINARIVSIGLESEKSKMEELILKVKAEGDSVGGVIECTAENLPVGLGGPLFEGMESRISAAAFAIPAVKGIEFGAGAEAALMSGSENNDEFTVQDGKIVTVTNNCGGILGGITNGMPLVFRLFIKPTPSIAKTQRSVDLSSMEEKNISVHGRHDPCIVPRALPCAEAVAALAIYDALLGRKKEL